MDTNSTLPESIPLYRRAYLFDDVARLRYDFFIRGHTVYSVGYENTMLSPEMHKLLDASLRKGRECDIMLVWDLAKRLHPSRIETCNMPECKEGSRVFMRDCSKLNIFGDGTAAFVCHKHKRLLLDMPVLAPIPLSTGNSIEPNAMMVVICET